MAIVYFDSSAFVKLMIEEDGSDLAAALWDGCDAAVSSRVAYPEVCAALATAARSGRLTAGQRRRAGDYWNEFWAATRPVELTASVAAEAGRLAGTHALRGADAIHLASVLAVGADATIFAVWNQRLRAGAESAGVALAPADVT